MSRQVWEFKLVSPDVKRVSQGIAKGRLKMLKLWLKKNDENK